MSVCLSLLSLDGSITSQSSLTAAHWLILVLTRLTSPLGAPHWCQLLLRVTLSLLHGSQTCTFSPNIVVFKLHVDKMLLCVAQQSAAVEMLVSVMLPTLKSCCGTTNTTSPCLLGFFGQ